MPQNSFLYKTLRSWYRRYQDVWSFDILHAYILYKNDIHFIQIGSNDGDHNDPLTDYIKEAGWKGILVEPVPYLFERLKSNYTACQHNLFFENSAVASESGMLKFYRLEKNDTLDLPEYYDQLGSLKKEVVLKHKDCVPSFNELFIEDLVKAITFRELLEKYQVDKLNLIHIDTEGYDYEIINTIPFEDLDIDLVMFEHRHLGASDYRKAMKIFQHNGYIVHKKDHADTVAIKEHVLSGIISARNHAV